MQATVGLEGWEDVFVSASSLEQCVSHQKTLASEDAALFIMCTLLIQFKRIFNFVWNVILTFIHFYNIRSLYLYISILSQFQMINDHNLKSTHDDSIHTSK